jgi:hypothetical protein
VNRPTSRVRLIEARMHITHARVLIQAAEADHDAGARHSAIAAMLVAAQEMERNLRYFLDSTAAETEEEA